jgi:hypothetical protein
VSCSAASLEAGVPLAATATTAARWLLVELPGAWERDASDHELPAFDGRTMLIRRPGRSGPDRAIFVADATEDGGRLRRLASLDALDGGEEVAETLLLVCCHGRRDVCCARLGKPVFEAVREIPGVWQSSHHGGHRFAANVLALPAGIQLGRVDPHEAPALAAVLAEGRIPLEHYRGRTLYSARVQAAEVAVRRTRGLDRVGDIRFVADDGELIEVAVPDGVVTCRVEETAGPAIPPSCGAEPEPTVVFSVDVESG